MDELTLTPLELIGRIAALVPPPRTHRHRYFGVLAPNSPLRVVVTALAAPSQPAKAQAEPVITGEGAPAVAPLGNAVPIQPELDLLAQTKQQTVLAGAQEMQRAKSELFASFAKQKQRA